MSQGLTKLQEELKFIRKLGCLAHIGGQLVQSIEIFIIGKLVL